MAEERVFKLRERDDMLRHLADADPARSTHMQQRLFPVFLEEAGLEISQFGLVRMVVLTLQEYRRDSGLTDFSLLHLVPRLIDALVADTAAAAAAKAEFERIVAVRK